MSTILARRWDVKYLVALHETHEESSRDTEYSQAQSLNLAEIRHVDEGPGRRSESSNPGANVEDFLPWLDDYDEGVQIDIRKVKRNLTKASGKA